MTVESARKSWQEFLENQEMSGQGATFKNTTRHTKPNQCFHIRCSGLGLGGLKPMGENFAFFTFFTFSAFCWPYGVFPLNVIQESTLEEKMETSLPRLLPIFCPSLPHLFPHCCFV